MMKYKKSASRFMMFVSLTVALSGLNNGYAQDQSNYTTVDSIAAVVNDGVITMRELNARIAEIKQNISKQGGAQNLPSDADLRHQVLERMIVEKSQEQEAAQQGIRVDDNQLDRTIAMIAEQNNLSLDQLRARIEADGTSYKTYRENIRQDIMMQRLRERNVDNQVAVSEKDVDVFLENQSNKESQSINEEWRLAQLFVHVPENASQNDIQAAYQRAQYLYSLAQGTPDFARIAKLNSDGQEADNGGDLGMRPATSWPPQFIDVIRNVSVGGISPVIQTEYGFHVIKVLDKRGLGTSKDPVAVMQTHVRHILIKPSAILSSEQARDKLAAIRQRIANGVDFADMAKQYSNDSSAPQGGDLGWIGPGETVPPFEAAMNALPLNTVSDLVESQFGWHLIQVLDRRQQDVTDEVRRGKARQALREARLQTAFEDWARQVRDSAYVEIRLDQ